MTGVFLEQKAYYASLKFVTSQPENFQDTYASLVDENSKVFEKDKELENEWHQIDMTTKLSKKVCIFIFHLFTFWSQNC